MYAATDPYMTYELAQYQIKQMNDPSNIKIKELFWNVEMPVLEVVTDMELSGIEMDMEYHNRLQIKYHKILDEKTDDLMKEMSVIQPKIDEWRKTKDAQTPQKTANGKSGKSKSEQLTNPINFGSSTQMAILLYDVLKLPVVNPKKPRSTGKEELKKFADEYDSEFCKKLQELKEFQKLVDAFLDTLPSTVRKSTGRVHCNYNQLGTDTGRFSCSNPNLQQIPSHNKEIRLMFKARDGYTLVGSDFSQQEPRLLANYSKDETMIQAYKDGKDLYSTIASTVYHNNYEDNLEKFADGTGNPDGKKRRGSVKGLLLGIMYGMGIESIAKTIKGTKEEAKSILDGFYQGFPNVRKWMDKTVEDATKTGYVEDWYGRRRRLPDIQLPQYTVKFKDRNRNLHFNPLLGCVGENNTDPILDKYLNLAMNTKSFKELDVVKKQASSDGVDVFSNNSEIAEAKRKGVNARIQGGAATMTKIAMIHIHKDSELQRLGFKLLLCVHDELIGECPKENADEVADRLTYLMKTCIQDKCIVPFKCDADICDHWYYNDYCDVLKSEMKDLVKSGLTNEESFIEMQNRHTESTEEQLKKILL